MFAPQAVRKYAFLGDPAGVAAAARWRRDVPQATHTGILKIADLEIDCAVLEDRRRVLSQRSVNRALGRKHGGTEFRLSQSEAGGGLPIFLVAKSLQPFISAELRAVVDQPIVYDAARLTNGFSKKLENHAAAVSLYVAHYNLQEWHQLIRDGTGPWRHSKIGVVHGSSHQARNENWVHHEDGRRS
jgi:hypothetical protein